jgi:diguanylate cyclase (GGDEF)-like protein
LERRLTQTDDALTESRVRERRSRHDALHDPATSLPNMTLFSDRIGNALAQAERHTRHLAVLFLDLDNFKNINDTYGHDVGDRVLQTVAERLGAGLRGGDTVGRRGGDEFLILMLDVNDKPDVAGSASRVLKSVAAPCRIDGVTITVTASIGVAMYPGDGRTAEGLMKHADVAMYAAKKQQAGVLLYSELAAASE